MAWMLWMAWMLLWRDSEYSRVDNDDIVPGNRNGSLDMDDEDNNASYKMSIPDDQRIN